jgi:hypothetical protein
MTGERLKEKGNEIERKKEREVMKQN